MIFQRSFMKYRQFCLYSACYVLKVVASVRVSSAGVRAPVRDSLPPVRSAAQDDPLPEAVSEAVSRFRPPVQKHLLRMYGKWGLSAVRWADRQVPAGLRPHGTGCVQRAPRGTQVRPAVGACAPMRTRLTAHVLRGALQPWGGALRRAGRHKNWWHSGTRRAARASVMLPETELGVIQRLTRHWIHFSHLSKIKIIFILYK